MDEYVVVVQPGADLPAVGGTLRLGSGLTNKQYDVTVKKIVSMKWNKYNNLVVVVKGCRKEV